MEINRQLDLLSYGHEYELPSLERLDPSVRQILPPLETILHLSVPAPTQSSRSVCLYFTAICCAHIDPPKEPKSFVPSVDLQHSLRAAKSQDRSANELMERLLSELNDYAFSRKKTVRKALKERELAVHHCLSSIDKTKLRSRREARVFSREREMFRTGAEGCIAMVACRACLM